VIRHCVIKFVSDMRQVSGFSLRLHHKFYVLLMLFVLVCVLWCSTCIDYMSNLAGLLLDEGTAYPWGTLAFTPTLYSKAK
jgi:hypothetical protein